MASEITIARPYAKALFSVAADHDLLKPWGEVLAALGLIAEDKAVAHLVNDPKVSKESLSELFLDLSRAVAADAVAAIGGRLEPFIALLIEEKRLMALPQIALLYHRLLAEQKQLLEVDVFSAYPLSVSQQDKLKGAIEARFKSEVSLAFHEDASLIGGAIIRSNTWVIDSSVRGQLTGLKDCLSVE